MAVHDKDLCGFFESKVGDDFFPWFIVWLNISLQYCSKCQFLSQGCIDSHEKRLGSFVHP